MCEVRFSLYDGDIWRHIQGYSMLGKYKDIQQPMGYIKQERTETTYAKETYTSDYTAGQISDLFSNFT